MSRNQNRVNISQVPAQQSSIYTPPTTHVVLPSKGRFYPEGHPLHNCESIEIKEMTTKEEEILMNESLLQQGLVVDRLIESVIINNNVSADTLLVGDKNAIIIAMRTEGYGKEYEISVPCPACGHLNEKEVDLSLLKPAEEATDLEMTPNGTFMVTLPKTKVVVELKLLTGEDEKIILETNEKTKKYGLERPIATQYSRMIVSVNGNTDSSEISALVSNLPIRDSRVIRKTYKKANPDMDMSFHFQCDNCNHERGMEVPITANFFWAD